MDLTQLEEGPACRFSDWPNPDVPDIAAGVYTVWDGDDFIYVGMSGRGWSVDDIRRMRRDGHKTTGLFTRLNSHASGRRSGDQFCVYVCDRFVVPSLTPGELRAVGRGELSLDQRTRDHIASRFTYRFVEVPDGRTALEVEKRVQRGELRAGRPHLNPLRE